MREQVLKQMPDLPASPEMQNWEIRDFSEGQSTKLTITSCRKMRQGIARTLSRYIGSLKSGAVRHD